MLLTNIRYQRTQIPQYYHKKINKCLSHIVDNIILAISELDYARITVHVSEITQIYLHFSIK